MEENENESNENEDGVRRWTMEDEISRSLDGMSSRLLVALQMAGETREWRGGGEGGIDDVDFESRMVRVGRALRNVLDRKLDHGRGLLEEMLNSGEIRKLDALIGKSAREGRLDTSFFQVLSVNMRDAAMNDGVGIDDDDDGKDKINASTVVGGDVAASTGANRPQILQHIYTRCQEELEKNVPAGIGLLNKLLRTEISSIRDNQLRHYLGPQATTITSPDGKVIELPNSNGKPLVSHVEFANAISDAISRIRDVERAGGTDKLTASSLIEGVRRIAIEARTVLASVHGESGDVVVEYQVALQPVFRPVGGAVNVTAAVADTNATAAAK
ncbi:hypothetical protein ACHAXA_003206 [Cyclostephanos tholiformis]|uniref:Uncharacterized protein n=1 Tax=Cyclostephanos tholiformis TaxID=382380 RepID=A0ABD3RYK9_9STRA